jgi:hypothetical protein
MLSPRGTPAPPRRPEGAIKSRPSAEGLDPDEAILEYEGEAHAYRPTDPRWTRYIDAVQAGLAAGSVAPSEMEGMRAAVAFAEKEFGEISQLFDREGSIGPRNFALAAQWRMQRALSIPTTAADVLDPIETPPADGVSADLSVWQAEESPFSGVEIQVCRKTSTVQFCAWDHGDPQNQQSSAIPFVKAVELVDWLRANLPTTTQAHLGRPISDTARLDFLDEMNRRLNASYGTTYRWKLIVNHNVNRLMLGQMAVDLNDSEARGLPSCREAIDEAMRDIKQRRGCPAQIKEA